MAILCAYTDKNNYDYGVSCFPFFNMDSGILNSKADGIEWKKYEVNSIQGNCKKNRVNKLEINNHVAISKLIAKSSES